MNAACPLVFPPGRRYSTVNHRFDRSESLAFRCGHARLKHQHTLSA